MTVASDFFCGKYLNRDRAGANVPAAALFAVASRGRMASPDISVLRRVCSCLRRLGYRSVRTADSRPAGARGGRGSSTCGREPVILPATLAPRSTRICSIDQKRLQAAVEFGGDDGGSRGCCLCSCRVGAARGGPGLDRRSYSAFYR